MFFDKKKDIGAAILTPDGPVDDVGDPDEHLHAIADDLVQAVHAKDVKGVTAALRAFWDCIRDDDSLQDEGSGA